MGTSARGIHTPQIFYLIKKLFKIQSCNSLIINSNVTIMSYNQLFYHFICASYCLLTNYTYLCIVKKH